MKWLVWSALTLTAVILVVWITGALLPRSHSVSRSIQLRQPPEVVWDVVTGPPSWRPEIKSYQQLPAHRRPQDVARNRQPCQRNHV